MKKIVSLLLCLALTLSLAMFTSCGEQNSESNGSSANPATCQHTETEIEVILPVTCTTDGKQITKCKQCGKQVGEIVTIPKLGHEFVAGFCVHTGCVTKDPDNNRFYANALVSLVDTTYYNFANTGDVTVAIGDNVYTLKTVTLLGGKSEGALTEDDNQQLAKDLISVKVEGEGSIKVNDTTTVVPMESTVRLVKDESELKLLVVTNGVEQFYVRVDNAVIVRIMEYIKETISSSAGQLPDAGTSGSVDYAALIKSLLDSIRTADGSDQTVSQLNTALHNIVVSIADIKTVEEGYEIVLNPEKIKAFNHTIATQPLESFVNNMFGDKTFDSIAALLRMAANAGQSSESGVTIDFDVEALIKDCKTLSLYQIINKYDNNTEDTDFEAEINNVVDTFKGLTISFVLDGKGNLLKSKIKAENFTPVEESSSDITGPSGNVIGQITIPGVTINGEFELNFKRERITGDEYKQFEGVIGTSDTDGIEAGEYEGFVYNENDPCVKITYTVDAKGNIVSATSYFKIVKNYETGEADYYKVVCNNPVTVQRELDNNGNLVYTFTNILSEKDYSVDLGVKIYVTDENYENATLLTDEAVISSITSYIGEVDFTLVAKIVPENPTVNPENPTDNPEA